MSEVNAVAEDMVWYNSLKRYVPIISIFVSRHCASNLSSQACFKNLFCHANILNGVQTLSAHLWALLVWSELGIPHTLSIPVTDLPR